MCWEWVFPSLMIPPVPQNQHWMTRHAQKPAPTSCDCRTVRGLRGGRREERMLGCCFSATGWFSSSFGWKVAMGGVSNCFLWLFCVTVTVAHFSWEDSSPGCSSRCSGSRSCRTAVAGKEPQQTRLNNKLHGASRTVLCQNVPNQTNYRVSLLLVKPFYIHMDLVLVF